jgi:hypothetical protein
MCQKKKKYGMSETVEKIPRGLMRDKLLCVMGRKNKEHRINKSRENIVSFDTIRLLFSVSA